MCDIFTYAEENRKEKNKNKNKNKKRKHIIHACLVRFSSLQLPFAKLSLSRLDSRHFHFRFLPYEYYYRY